MSRFENIYGAAFEAEASAPGRVNLLGEHTDYNDGFVLPIATLQQTRVTMRRSSALEFSLHAAELGQTMRFTMAQPPAKQFARYVFGCLVLAQDHAGQGMQLPPLDIHVASSVPIGVGLSSSAALEVANLRCPRQLLGLLLDDVQIARLAQRAEIEYAGVRRGIMDQMASSLAGTTRALLLDTRSLARRFVALPAGSSVLVLDSGISRSLANSGCWAWLRCAMCLAWRTLAPLLDLLLRRARHVVMENARVLQAADCSSAAFGELMNASHASLRDDYEVSTTGLDTLVALLQAQPGVFGVRLTGAGFGGACVALCDSSALPEASRAVLGTCRQTGGAARQLVPPES